MTAGLLFSDNNTMYKGLIEINPGYITWYKMSLSSTSLELLGSKEIKIKKILNFPYRESDLVSYEEMIRFAISILDSEKCQGINIISVGDFPAMFIARLNEGANLERINDEQWKIIVSRHIKKRTLNIWFERFCVKLGWVSKGIKHVQSFTVRNDTIVATKFVMLKSVSIRMSLYDLPKDIEKINVGGQFNQSDDDYISCVILVLAKIYPYAKIFYDLPSFIEIYTRRNLKSYT